MLQKRCLIFVFKFTEAKDVNLKGSVHKYAFLDDNAKRVR